MPESLVIYNRKSRETLTFANLPSPETCKLLRAKGWDFDKRSAQWFRTSGQLSTLSEASIEHLA